MDKWDVFDVGYWLEANGLAEYKDIFKGKNPLSILIQEITQHEKGWQLWKGGPHVLSCQIVMDQKYRIQE